MGTSPAEPTMPRDSTYGAAERVVVRRGRRAASSGDSRNSATCWPADQRAHAAVGREVVEGAHVDPGDLARAIGHVDTSTGMRLLVGQGRAGLAPLRHHDDARVGLVGVDEGAEPAEADRVVERGLPLALVGVDVARHLGLELGGDAERVVDDDPAQVVDAALELVEPGRGALEPVGGADVEHEEAVDVADQRLVVEVLGEQHGVLRVERRRCRRRRGSSPARWR